MAVFGLVLQVLPAVLLASETSAAASKARSIWSVGLPQGGVEVINELPSAEAFYDKYIQDKGGAFAGHGKPVLLEGAARIMPSYQLWTDKYLEETYGDVLLDQVETEKKETRTKYPFEDWTLKKFLSKYNSSTLYSTASTPKGLADEVYFLPVMNCGGYSRKLASTVTWFSSGSTKSVIHKDGQDNIHCMFAGRKDWILWPSTVKMQSKSMGWVNAEQEARQDPAFKDAYGSYIGKIDVDDVDLQRFPAWDELKWWNMTLKAGDCAYIPRGWYHFVEAPAQRSISTHVWFESGKKFNAKACEVLEQKGFDPSDYLLRFSDCTFGYEDGRKESGTKCRMPTKPLKSHPRSEL